MNSFDFNVRKSDKNDKYWIDRYIGENWGSREVVVLSKIFIPSGLKGFVAESNNEKLGLVTYKINYPFGQIITLDSKIENRGIGTKLIEYVKSEAKLKGCNEIKLFTTNDNIHAISFYINRGFKIANIYHDSIKEARKLKPEIPEFGKNGIIIKDEIEMILNIG